ncbi:MAG: hypothetical protein ACYTCU_07465, partial [Planctomycetota bacterium]
MIELRLHPPERDDQRVVFRWESDRPLPIYRDASFTLEFPPEVDLSRVPLALWWRVFLLCMHAHWALLRPCRVVLPVTLGPDEAAFWRRLALAHAATLEAYRTGTDQPFEHRAAGGLEIVEQGPPLPDVPRLPETGRCASAFSGGKDGLVQLGLLSELAHPTTLVTVSSPLPPLADHLTERRRQVLAEVVRRRPVDLVEVRSDWRACWNNGWPRTLGYLPAVNEVSDTHLYTAVMLACAYARGANHLFLASENEVSENVLHGGRYVQHPHGMYSAFTQGALSELFGRWGMRLGSLLVALNSHQVQALLSVRYRDLGDLQYSCWNTPNGRSACSACSQCLRLAALVLHLGDSPARQGIDLPEVLIAQRAWAPRAPTGSGLPKETVSARLAAQVLIALREADEELVRAEIARAAPGVGQTLRRRAAWRA